MCANRPLVDVLVVDDHPGQAGTTADVLRAAGLTVLTASTVDEAQSICSARRFCAIVLDQGVAESSEDFLALASDLPSVVVVSGSTPEAIAEFGERHRDHVFLSLRKPVPPQRLIEVVQAAIDETRLLRMDPRGWTST